MFIEIQAYKPNMKDTEQVLVDTNKMSMVSKTGDGQPWFMYEGVAVVIKMSFEDFSKQLKAVKVD